jgi:hypothetical protein
MKPIKLCLFFYFLSAIVFIYVIFQLISGTHYSFGLGNVSTVLRLGDPFGFYFGIIVDLVISLLILFAGIQTHKFHKKK